MEVEMETEVSAVKLKTSVLKRVLARLVDGLVAWAFALVLPPIGILVGIVYLAVADGVQKGQSLGKMVFGLEVVGTKLTNPLNLFATVEIHGSSFKWSSLIFSLFFFMQIPPSGVYG